MEFEAGDEKSSMGARGLTFDMILAAPLLAVIPNPKHHEQIILIVNIEGYAIAAPCKPLGEGRWLIVTAYQSRKYTKHYL
jgi:hypothetical protein